MHKFGSTYWAIQYSSWGIKNVWKIIAAITQFKTKAVFKLKKINFFACYYHFRKKKYCYPHLSKANKLYVSGNFLFWDSLFKEKDTRLFIDSARSSHSSSVETRLVKEQVVSLRNSFELESLEFLFFFTVYKM